MQLGAAHWSVSSYYCDVNMGTVNILFCVVCVCACARVRAFLGMCVPVVFSSDGRWDWRMPVQGGTIVQLLDFTALKLAVVTARRNSVKASIDHRMTHRRWTGSIESNDGRFLKGFLSTHEHHVLYAPSGLQHMGGHVLYHRVSVRHVFSLLLSIPSDILGGKDWATFIFLFSYLILSVCLKFISLAYRHRVVKRAPFTEACYAACLKVFCLQMFWGMIYSCDE